MKKLIISIAVCQMAGVVGSLFTISAIPEWYSTLAKPAFSPPNWLFGPAWIALYALMGVSLYFVWSSSSDGNRKRTAMTVFFVHLFFNAVWSIIFFGFQNIGLAFVDILIILIMIVVLIKLFWPIDHRAAYLLFPYLAWVSFATVLNYFLLILNSLHV